MLANKFMVVDFLRHLITEDEIFLQVPDHESYRGQLGLLRRLQQTADKFENKRRF
jgi:hypothetical protein